MDTCIGNDKPRPHLLRWSQLQTRFLDGLGALGIAREDVSGVLCTHLHADHVGWNTRLIDGKWRPTIPRGKHYFARCEFEEALKTDETGSKQAMAFEDSVRHLMKSG